MKTARVESIHVEAQPAASILRCAQLDKEIARLVAGSMVQLFTTNAVGEEFLLALTDPAGTRAVPGTQVAPPSEANKTGCAIRERSPEFYSDV
jgi:hypothetical protein